MRNTILPAILVLAAICLSNSVRAEDLVWATGRVVDAEGRPMANAQVAVYDDANKVSDYARTDSQGEYAVAVPRRVLHIEHHHGHGFIAEVFGGVSRLVIGTVGFVANPLRAGVRAVTSSQAAAFADPLTKGGIAVGGAVIDKALFVVSPRPHRRTELEERKMPGALLVKVIAPDRSDVVGVARIYWLQDETFRAGGRQTHTLAAWIDPVELAPAGSEKPSRIDGRYLMFTAARIEPSLAEHGQLVRISAILLSPPSPTVHCVVVARSSRTGQKWELTPTGNGRYSCEFAIDKHFPFDDQTISLIAYAADERHPGRRPDAERAIEGAGMWNPKQPFQYDPLLVVSRSRADLTLTVLRPQKQKHR